MSENNILLAKELFRKYGGSHFHMEREGEYSFYKSLNITKDQEQLWIGELQKELMEKVKNDNTVGHNYNTLCSSVRQYKSLDMLKALVDLMKDRKQSADTFTLVLMAEGLLNIVEYFEKNGLRNDKTTTLAKTASLEILRYLVSRPVSVAPVYLQESYIIDLNDHQYILQRIRDELASWA